MTINLLSLSFVMICHSFLDDFSQLLCCIDMSSGLKRQRQLKASEEETVRAEDPIEKWVETVRANGGWKVGRWRPLHNLNNLKEVRCDRKQDGFLAIDGRKINLYFFFQPTFTIREYVEGVRSHPLTAIYEAEPLKPM